MLLAKKLVLVDESTIAKLSRLSNIRGKRFTNLVNDILKLEIEADEKLNLSLKDIMHHYKLLDILLKFTAVIPREPFNELLNSSYAKKSGKEWRESGILLGKQFRLCYNSTTEILSIIPQLAKTLQPKVNTSINFNSETLTLTCISTSVTPTELRLLTYFLEGFISALNYKLKKKEFPRNKISVLKFVTVNKS